MARPLRPTSSAPEELAPPASPSAVERGCAAAAARSLRSQRTEFCRLAHAAAFRGRTEPAAYGGGVAWEWSVSRSGMEAKKGCAYTASSPAAPKRRSGLGSSSASTSALAASGNPRGKSSAEGRKSRMAAASAASPSAHTGGRPARHMYRKHPRAQQSEARVMAPPRTTSGARYASVPSNRSSSPSPSPSPLLAATAVSSPGASGCAGMAIPRLTRQSPSRSVPTMFRASSTMPYP
mmetsp:Transcript_1950/g.7157  ORF Transcript_1950/g.7157 Transcript_1950/m.7157 type:complete len:236 (+) Transcript_1950:279-986(+)